MTVAKRLLRLVRYLLPITLIASVWLALYPFWLRCEFPKPHSLAYKDSAKSVSTAYFPSEAPFRLLAFGDPQLEGDSSLPDPDEPLFPSVNIFLEGIAQKKWTSIPRDFVATLKEAILEEIPRNLKSFRKRVDLFGNDYYLAHIYRTLHWWTQPTHITVLGDLLGSQWVSDEEFENRAWRFWNRVFENGERVPDELMSNFVDGEGHTPTITLGEDEAWSKRIINIAGNHDIGYAGDIEEHRIARFERVFGKVNWDIRFELPAGKNNASQSQSLPSIHIIVLNSMNLDGPARSPHLASQTYDFMNKVIQRSRPVEDRKASLKAYLD
jgi:hypothetical protein